MGVAPAFTLGTEVYWRAATKRAANEPCVRGPAPLDLTMAVEYGGVLIWEVDVLAQTLTFSEAVIVDLLQHPAESLTRQYHQWKDLFPDGDWARVEAAIDDCISGVASEVVVQPRLCTADGSLRWFQMRGMPVRDAVGRVIRLMGALVDVTEQKVAERRLAEQEVFYREFVENLPCGAVMVKGERVFINAAVERLTGYSRNDLATLDDWFCRMNPGRAQLARDVYESDRATKPVRKDLCRLTIRSGYSRFVEVAATAQAELDIWVLRDVTQEMRNDRLLSQTERLAASGGWELDCETGRFYWTDGMYRLHETTPAETKLDRQRIIDFFVPEHRELAKSKLDAALKAAEPWDYVTEKQTARGNRFRVRSMGVPEVSGGRVVRVFGAIIEVNYPPPRLSSLVGACEVKSQSTP